MRVETETEKARSQYTYRQTVALEELDNRGARAGLYREARDVIFSPTGERTERMLNAPTHSLKRLVLTPEDFRDIREIQPFVFTEDLRFVYETKFRGDEKIEDEDCWVLQVRPRQTLQGQRLFDGMFWVNKKGLGIVKSEGHAVPEVRSMHSENLFPQFTTVRRLIDGKHRFPVLTSADDTLQFRTGPIRIRLNIRYSDYKRFGSESTVTFEEKK